MKAAPFEYLRAKDLDEACRALAGDAMIIAGGQTLVPLMAMRFARPRLLVDINDIAELRGIGAAGDEVIVKACTRQADALASALVAERVPLLAKALPFVGHAQTRNRGTVGGSIALGDPSAEIPLVAVALDARIALRSANASRTVAAAQLFRAPMETVREPGECLVEVAFPMWRGGRVSCGFQEVAERHGDFAIAAAAVQLLFDAGGVCRRAAVAVGGASPTPVRVPEAEAMLVGRTVDAEIARAAGERAAHVIEPSSDNHASADYRHRVAPTLVARAIAEAAACS